MIELVTVVGRGRSAQRGGEDEVKRERTHSRRSAMSKKEEESRTREKGGDERHQEEGLRTRRKEEMKGIRKRPERGTRGGKTEMRRRRTVYLGPSFLL